MKKKIIGAIIGAGVFGSINEAVDRIGIKKESPTKKTFVGIALVGVAVAVCEFAVVSLKRIIRQKTI